ncbi:MAG: putative redox protein [Frankiales bacterium]|jgi:organic hydroperoxide reductase OsmC/OhrA|nr:putative redox protein [Frankiales bacterium]
MVDKSHSYQVEVVWTGNLGAGTMNYRSYSRDHVAGAAGKPEIEGSADRAFRGSNARWNPEELLVVSLSQCHLLWYLDLAARAGVVVLEYRDNPVGTMLEQPDGAGQFSEVTLRPNVVVAEPSMCELALELHDRAHHLCFIARSVNFPVRHEPTITANAD